MFVFQAAQQGHSQIVNLLLEANASPNTVSNVSVNSLLFACQWPFAVKRYIINFENVNETNICCLDSRKGQLVPSLVRVNVASESIQNRSLFFTLSPSV